MPTEQLQLGVAKLLVQNQVYALPTLRCFLFTDASSPTIKMANNVGMSPSVTLTLDSNNEANLSGMFLQTTGTNVNVVVKSY